VTTDRALLTYKEDMTEANLSEAEMKFIRDHRGDATYTVFTAIQNLRADGM